MAYDPHSAYQPPSRHYYPANAPPQSPFDQPRRAPNIQQGYQNQMGDMSRYARHAPDAQHGDAYGYASNHDGRQVQSAAGYYQEPRAYQGAAIQHPASYVDEPRQTTRQSPRPGRSQESRLGHSGGPAFRTQVYQEPQYAQSSPQQSQHPPQHDHRTEAHRAQAMQANGMHAGNTRPQAQKHRPPPLDSVPDDRLPPNSSSRQEKREPRRPLIEPVSPTGLPQDNAFPVFPTKHVVAKKKDNQDRGQRPSHERKRPSTADGGLERPDHRKADSPPQQRLPQKPSGYNGQDATYQDRHNVNAREQCHGAQSQLSSTVTHDFAHDTFSDPARVSAERVRERHPQQHQQQHEYNEGHENYHADHRPQRPSDEIMRHPIQSNGYNAALPEHIQQVQSADTRRGIPRQGPIPVQHGFLDQTQPYLPNGVGHDYNEIHGNMNAPLDAHKQAAPRGHHAKSNSLSEMYADYYSDDFGHGPHAAVAPMADRDAQIEAEMPDFDNVASAQSRTHKRQTIDEHLSNATITRHAAPPMPPMPNNQLYQHASHAASQPSLRRGSDDQRGAFNGFEFDVPPSPASMYAPSFAQTSAYGNGVSQDRHHGPPQQPGFPAAQQPRQLASQTKDPRQRQRQQDQSLGPFSPQHQGQRPDVLRFNSGQTMRSDPGPGPGGPATPLHARPGQVQLHQQSNASPTQQYTNPDALPQHPTPVRPGLMNNSPPSQTSSTRKMGPMPIRQSPNAVPPQTPSVNGRSSLDSRRLSQSQPVTQAEINHLQSLVNAHPQDHKTALLLAQKLVEAATVLASENGRLDPRQTAKNREKYILDAHRRVKKLASNGYPDAMFYLADCHGSGQLGLPVDSKEAFNLYQAAAKAGHGQAAYRTAMCCEIGPDEGGGTRRDVQKAVQWYRRAAQLQDVSAMFKLGMILLKGLLGQQKNVAEAQTWLKRASERASKENPHALHELGLLYEPDNSDPAVKAKIVPDEAYARELFTKAAKLGYKNSQFRLGQAYEYGSLGLPIDARGSIAWYSKAAAQGEHGAELALSGWYLTGAEGILEHSDQEAYLWARKAASSEPPMAKAMFAMGYYTETGIGCPKSVEEAKKWYGRAAAYKFPKAIERLEELKRGGTDARSARPDIKGARLQRRDQKRDEAECSVM